MVTYLSQIHTLVSKLVLIHIYYVTDFGHLITYYFNITHLKIWNGKLVKWFYICFMMFLLPPSYRIKKWNYRVKLQKKDLILSWKGKLMEKVSCIFCFFPRGKCLQ